MHKGTKRKMKYKNNEHKMQIRISPSVLNCRIKNFSPSDEMRRFKFKDTFEVEGFTTKGLVMLPEVPQQPLHNLPLCLSLTVREHRRATTRSVLLWFLCVLCILRVLWRSSHRGWILASTRAETRTDVLFIGRGRRGGDWTLNWADLVAAGG